MDFEKLFNSFSNIKVAVIGDLMLDTYWWGHVERISPEAPVPVVTLDSSELRIGGAGNVALNLVSLGAKTSIFSVIGEDETGKSLDKMLADSGIDTSYLICSRTRKTTNKTRVISRNQQMLRLDSETATDLSTDAEEALIDRISTYIQDEQPSVVVLEDYNKGVLTETVIRRVVSICKEANIVTAVDPKKKNFFAYQNVTLFKPNLKEVREGLNVLLDEVSIGSLHNIHELLAEKLRHQISFITLSERGVFYDAADGRAIIPSHFRNIADVSGAGDTVIAVGSLVYAASGNVKLMAEIANIAGGLVCETVGTIAVDKQQLLQECKLLLSN